MYLLMFNQSTEIIYPEHWWWFQDQDQLDEGAYFINDKLQALITAQCMFIFMFKNVPGY